MLRVKFTKFEFGNSDDNNNNDEEGSRNDSEEKCSIEFSNTVSSVIISGIRQQPGSAAAHDDSNDERGGGASGGGGGIQELIEKSSILGKTLTEAARITDVYEPLPFTDYSLFEESYDPKDFKINSDISYKNKCFFMPTIPIAVSITAERRTRQHIFHPYLYIVRLNHGKYSWQVELSFDEIKKAHKTLAKMVKEDLGRSCSDLSADEIREDWPLFPTGHDFLTHESDLKLRCHELEKYFSQVLKYPPFRDHPAILNLFDVSKLSFVDGLGPSVVEGLLQKRAVDIRIYSGESFHCLYAQRWICVKDSYIAHLLPDKDFNLGFPLLVDRKFKIKKTIKAGAYYVVQVKNLARLLNLKFKSSDQQNEWYDKLVNMLATSGRFFNDAGLLLNGSYAPVRSHQQCSWFINGAGYMENVMIALNNAKEEIFITDWWLCPELFLKRPTDDLQYRLDKILLKKSKQGVKIYILLYKEFTVALDLASSRTKNILTQYEKNPNIKVLRHPDHTPAGVFLWSHHEKSVIIDQSIGFMGGIDLCYGRWDDDHHRLVDLGKTKNITEIQPAQTFATPRIAPESSPSEPTEVNVGSDLQRTDTDANLPSLVKPELFFPAYYMNSQEAEERAPELAESGPAPDSCNDHLINALIGKISERGQNLNYVSEPEPVVQSKRNFRDLISDVKRKINLENKFLTTINDQRRKATRFFKSLSNENIAKSTYDEFANITLFKARPKSNSSSALDKLSNHDASYGDLFKGARKSIRSVTSDDTVLLDDTESFESRQPSQGTYYWIGKDYANTYKQDFVEIAEFGKDQFDRAVTPRMPWRDEALVMFGESARDLARHFIHRWNQCKREKVRHLTNYPFLLPKSHSEPYSSYEWFKGEVFNCSVQMTRSLDAWSGGITETEFSILNSYCDLIKKAEHYVYIENQYFVTTTNPTKDIEVKNPIAYEIAERIKRAHRENKKFRVYVVIPLLPGFDNQNAIQAVQYYNLRSMVSGEHSIYRELEKAGITDPSEYITFHSMRNWSVLMGNLVQEIIYVHSKLMIVDDRYVICGSANINDRSLIGKRDSELAAVVKDEEFVASHLNGHAWQAGKYAFSLREKIFKLHIGVYFNNPEQIDVSDCVCDEFYRMFRAVSNKNTTIYDEVFKCIPSDNILTFEDLKNYESLACLKRTDPIQGKVEMDKVSGYLVDFPLKFLSKEPKFYPAFFTKEGMAPTMMWT